MVQIDFMGPLPETINGNKYILSCIDLFDDKVTLEPTKTLKAMELVPILCKRVIIPFGVRKIKSDLGEPFVSKIVKSLSNIFKFSIHHTSGYRPQSNGIIERKHGDINIMIVMQQYIKDILFPDNSRDVN